jgi:hypothetical protein
MAGLCYVGSINQNQTGVQAITGVLFIFVCENAFTPMYSGTAITKLSCKINSLRLTEH